jgi:hypothetical protein
MAHQPVIIYKNILSHDAVSCLRDWFFAQDHYVDARSDCVSKSPRWSADDWPKHWIEDCVRQVHQDPFEVEMVHFFHNLTSRFNVHVDSGLGVEHQKLAQGVIFPLITQGEVGTVFFKNHWLGRCSKFSKSLESQTVGYQANGDPRNAVVTDYSSVENYSGRPFNQDAYNRYLTHLNMYDLEGLEFDCYAQWYPGDAIVFPRTQLHAASNGTLPKLGLSIFTNHEH